MILNFEHRPSGHCETGVTSNMLNYYGCNLSESMIFGLGDGLSFIYIPFMSFKGNALKFSFRAVPGSVFSGALKTLGIPVGVKRFVNKREEAMKEMDNLLAAGIPVGTVVGLFHLPHSPYRIHINVHTLCVVGKEGDEYTISDPSWHTTLLKISYSDLMRVRFPEGPFKPHGKMFWIKGKPVIPDLKPLIVRSIQKTCRKMIGFPLDSFFGVNGIFTLSKKIRKIEKRYGEKGAKLYLASIVQAIEEIGTGGAGYRFMYGIFLHEAAEIMNEPRLKEYSVEMTRIGELWRLFAVECGRKIKKRSELSYDDLADKVAEIAAAEKRLFVALKKEKL